MTTESSHISPHDDTEDSEVRIEQKPDLLFDATLYPHRSLKPRQVRRLVWALVAICGIASLRFIVVGAWPVVGFLAVDIAAIWLAFHLSFRSGQLYETLQLGEKDLILTRVHPSRRVESWRFDPYWVQLGLKTIDEDRNQLSLTSHGKTVVFGTFLTPTDRRKLKAALTPELARLKA